MLIQIQKKKINITDKEEAEYKCKICEEDITKEEKIKNKCEECGSYFCSECLYLYIKELIRNGKYSLFCPDCSFLYTNDKINKIEQILSFNIKDKEEVNNLKKLFEKSKTKELILSNPDLMFCPIVNCNGFAKKNNNNKGYNICTMGHKFCIKCGELWHENGIWKEDEIIDKIFEEYRKKYDLKNCPYCHIVTKKIGGCNHIKCQYCGKDWCWLCQEIFISTEEHYGNRSSRCFGRMEANLDIIICSKCENQIFDNNNNRTFSCDHNICDNCFIEILLESKTMIIFPVKLLNCIILGCKGFLLIRANNLINFIKETNNEKLIKKYKYSILFSEYGLQPFFPREYIKYIGIYCWIFDLIKDIFYCFREYDTLYNILRVIGIIFAIILFPVFIIIVPIFLHFAIKDLYYCKFLPDLREQNYNKIVYFSIVLGEEILSLVFLFSLIAWHYIYSILFFPIMFLVLLIRNLV